MFENVYLLQSAHCLHMRNGVKFGDATLVDTMIKDGLTDAFNGYHMGITAENVAKQYSISREDQDKFAAESQQRTEKSQKADSFAEEIVPVTIQSRKGNQVHIQQYTYCIAENFHKFHTTVFNYETFNELFLWV